MPRLVPLALLLVLGLTLGGHASGARTDATLTATVGPGASISLRDAAGASVTHLDPGSYTIKVDDVSTLHNFDLQGPGVSEATSIDGTGSATWAVSFVNGTYVFLCDAHPQTMKGTFTVGTPPPPAPVPTPKPAPGATALVATVGPGQTIALRRPSGARVTTLRHGRYRVTVHDRAAFHDFHLVGPGLNRKTGVPFVGTVVWTITLKAGVYRFQCDPHKAFMRGSFRVT